MNRSALLRWGMLSAALLCLRAVCPAQTPAATPAPPAVDLLESLYPGGVPAEDADTTAVKQTSLQTTATEALVPAGTLVVRRSRKPGVRLDDTTGTARLLGMT